MTTGREVRDGVEGQKKEEKKSLADITLCHLARELVACRSECRCVGVGKVKARR